MRALLVFIHPSYLIITYPKTSSIYLRGTIPHVKLLPPESTPAEHTVTSCESFELRTTSNAAALDTNGIQPRQAIVGGPLFAHIEDTRHPGYMDVPAASWPPAKPDLRRRPLAPSASTSQLLLLLYFNCRLSFVASAPIAATSTIICSCHRCCCCCHFRLLLLLPLTNRDCYYRKLQQLVMLLVLSLAITLRDPSIVVVQIAGTPL